jgi:hypothetical protein
MFSRTSGYSFRNSSAHAFARGYNAKAPDIETEPSRSEPAFFESVDAEDPQETRMDHAMMDNIAFDISRTVL